MFDTTLFKTNSLKVMHAWYKYASSLILGNATVYLYDAITVILSSKVCGLSHVPKFVGTYFVFAIWQAICTHASIACSPVHLVEW
jgi:hypothetical protein